MSTLDGVSRWLDNSQHSVFGKYRDSNESLTIRSAEHSGIQMETLDDQICISWRGRNSVNSDRNSGIRTSRYRGARRIRLLPPQRGFRHWVRTSSTARCWSWNSGRLGICTARSFGGGRGHETTTRPWSAPVGHRQPRVADVPAPTSASQQTLDPEDANVDRMIRGVCRGC